MAALLAGVTAAALGVLPWLLPVLPPPPAETTGPGDLPPLPYAARPEALRVASPAGGLLWPLPSKAWSWDEPSLDRRLHPRIDNLDGLYLGASPRGWYRLPGTTLRGALSLHGPIARQRLFPDPAAVARLRAAASATVAALREVLPQVKAGVPERQVERALIAAMAAHGCGRESFPLVLASGPSAAAPHGAGNGAVLAEGTLLVADIGCYWDHYAIDYTRTLPVGGRFSERQRLLYQNVLDAQDAAAAACKPGVKLAGAAGPGEPKSLNQRAREVLQSRAPDHQDHTIEPGTYLEGELGIRIEDTYLVTKDGCEKLTEGFPAEVAAVEAALGPANAPVASPLEAAPDQIIR